MNPEIKAEWLVRLRDPNAKQAKARLKQGDAFCCLGVLCDIHAKHTQNCWDTDIYLNKGVLPPQEVYDWAGITEEQLSRNVFGGRSIRLDNKDLADMNDAGKTFLEIADFIEANL